MKSHDKIATRLALILNKFNSGEKFTIEELVEEFNVTKRTIQRDILERLFSRLDKRERYVIEKSFSEKKSLVEISNELGVTKERVRQIKCSALNKLRKRSVEDGIKFRGFNRSTKTGTNETN